MRVVQFDPMGTTRWAAREVANELEKDNRYAITQSEMKKLVEEKGNLAAPWWEHITEGVSQVGWEASNGVYYLEDHLSKEVSKLSKKLRSEGRAVVSRSVVSQETTNMDVPRDEWGVVIDETMLDCGWKINEDDGLYYLPVKELVTENSLAYYLMNSFTVPDEP